MFGRGHRREANLSNTQKKREMKVHPDVAFYTKTRNHRKTV